MLDVNYIEDNFEYVEKQLNKRGGNFSQQLNKVIEKNKIRKSILLKVESLKSEKNNLSKQIGELMRNKNLDEAEKIKIQSLSFDSKITELDEKLKEVSKALINLLQFIPNVPNENMPIGKDDSDNYVVRTWNNGDLKKSNIPHWDIASKLGLVDFESGPKISGSRFLIYTGKGSKIVRALADILLTRHTNNGYKEFFIPLIVNAEAMYGTGQLPKFAEDAYQVGEQYLIPTAEVPLTNLHANEILEKTQLPLNYTAFSQCFRQEAGSAGRDTKGMIRLHQFNKVEMVKIVEPSYSMEELENLTKDAEAILQMFNLPYRVVELCTGDVGFSATKTYDLEVWFPEQNKYREISSCSNCGDFQARNMMTRFKDFDGKVKLVHTLNGSGVAIDRLFAAILENYFDGEKLILPEILKSYFNNEEFIK
ncbi:seryl-tRNA synthetase [Williamsoniiplasma somnilux]|uniref:Serine--tRNA ligase n=1 Tax=Williamsoniiplasma somnilux TaxID=215578 RepID=A0A2K8NX64_9MOLU|nr:serine--tRNA ligase [Williamsoniiplasma somnilux]ATZ18420.1 seryl-tRNA synthetase [Williamsoniiplasma somnilux]